MHLFDGKTVNLGQLGLADVGRHLFGQTALRQSEVARPASEGVAVGVDEEEPERCLDNVMDGGGWRINVMRFHQR